MSDKIKVYCCYGSMWGSTRQICEDIKVIFEEKFKAEGMEAEVHVSKTLKKEEMPHFDEAEIVYVATSIMRDAFRANVINFMKKNREAIEKKISGALLVNLPYIHLDKYILQFEEQIGYKPSVCMTTGGIINMKLYRTNEGLVRYCLDNRLPDIDPNLEFFGEINQGELAEFVDKLIEKYKNAK